MRKKSIRILVYIFGFLALIIAFMPAHYRRAIIHGHANIDDYRIFENRLVQNAQPIRWQRDSLYNLQTIAPAQMAVFDTFGTTAYVVVHNNKILYEQYWDGTSDSTRSNSFSAAKSIVSILIGCLFDEGKIKSLDQPITDFLPDFKNTNGYTLTIKNLLTMSSGIEWDEGYSSLFSPTTKAYYGNDLNQQIIGLNIGSEPGKVFNYQSCNTQLLAMVVAKASGKPVSEYASEKLWQPLGAEHPALWSLDQTGGVEKAYCCFNSTARDFARIGQMVLDSGQFNNRQIVSKAFLEQALSPATQLNDEAGDSCYYYGYQFWLMSHKGQKIAYARGILGQYIFIIPGLDAVVVRLGTDRSKEYQNHAPTDAYTYLDAAFKMLAK
ncbi:MAG: serine hydrolase domain-containing protein [Bacteroidales bacterium]